MDDSYLTIKKNSEGFYKEKGSKFLSFAYPVEEELQVKQIIDNLKATYHDARHHCFAFVIGKDRENFRANDGGEPPHSAGDPILRVIQSFEITNVLIVVVRYFGGTKLGISGLINAYKMAATDAIQKNEIFEKVIKETIILRFNYDQTNDIMRLINDYHLEIISQDFGADCKIELGVRQSQKQEVIEKLKLLSPKSIN